MRQAIGIEASLGYLKTMQRGSFHDTHSLGEREPWRQRAVRRIRPREPLEDDACAGTVPGASRGERWALTGAAPSPPPAGLRKGFGLSPHVQGRIQIGEAL